MAGSTENLKFAVYQYPGGPFVGEYDLTLSLSSSSSNGYYTVTAASGYFVQNGVTETVKGILSAESWDNNDNKFSLTNFTDTQGLAFELTNGTKINLHWSGSGTPYYLDASNNTDYEVNSSQFVLSAACYCRGTRITTPHGEVAIEALAVGDRVLTADGAERPVRWIGQRSLDTSRHPQPETVLPVLVCAGAFGEALPRRDLWLSPGHNVAIDGALVPIRALVNGRTIVQVGLRHVDYWHVELDQHDIIIAEGLAAESYLDTGNRSAFVGGAAFLEAHPDLSPRHWADTCLPLVKDGPALHRAKAALLARAGELGYAITDVDDLHIMADGMRCEPARIGDRRVAFLLPAGCAKIVLHSRTFVPSQIDWTSDDSRTLGVCVGRLQLDGAEAALAESALFGPGWYGMEDADAGGGQRWTDGAARLPAKTRLVVIDLASRGFYWAEQASNVVALSA